MDVNKVCSILGVDGLFPEFQPIFCVGSKKIIGIEGLIRGFSKGRIVSPDELFLKAERKGIKLELDQTARYLIFNEFKRYFLENTDFLLFFNFDASILDVCMSRPWQIFTLCERAELPPERVVIEIIETKVKRFDALQKFVNRYRDLGFLIALDDVGIEYSNLNRIPEIKPDFLKIDRLLIKGVENDEYKQKLLRSLAYLSKEIGCFTIAEGVETKEEILVTLEIGLNFHQGYKLALPSKAEGFDIDSYISKVAELKSEFLEFFTSVATNKKALYDEFKRIVKDIARRLSRLKDPSKLESRLKEIISGYPRIQDAYVVDMNGCLLTELIFNLHSDVSNKKKLLEMCSSKETAFASTITSTLFSVENLINSFQNLTYTSLRKAGFAPYPNFVDLALVSR